MSSPSDIINPDAVRNLALLKELNRAHLEKICRGARMVQLPKRARLYASDEHRWLTFLIDGSLQMAHGNTRAGALNSGTPEALRPLFEGSPANGAAFAASPVRLLRFEREQVKVLLSQQQASSIKVHEEKVTEADNYVFDDIVDAFEKRRLKVPALPEVVLRVRKVLVKPDTDAREVARVVQRDPVLTARLIQVANSPVYRGEHAVDSVHHAVMRVGMKAMRNLALALAVKQLFHARLPTTNKRMKLFYNMAALNAARCSILAKETQRLNAESAMLAGLTHDIGTVPILAYADDRPELFDQPQVLERTINHLRRPVSDWVLSSWDFDPAIIDVALEARKWSRNSGPELDYSDLINAVLLHARGIRGKQVPLAKLPVGRKLSTLGLEVTNCLPLIEERKEDIQVLLKLIS